MARAGKKILSMSRTTVTEVMEALAAIGSNCTGNCRLFMFKLIDTAFPFFRL